jgi:hypothetical protein
MDDASAELAASDREVMLAALVEQDRWAREAIQQKEQADRWRRRVDLAESHQEFDLATRAAQRARHHAGLAMTAEKRVAALEDVTHRHDPPRFYSSHLEWPDAKATATPSPADPIDRLATDRSVDARLAAIKAAYRASADMEGR